MSALDLHPKQQWIVLFAALAVCAGFWRWAEDVMVPANTVAVRAKGIPVGNNSDLYPRWLGARELLLRGRDPYSAEVTRDIQRGFYGRPLDPRKPSDPVKQEAFVYPLYVVFIMAPTITLPFGVVCEIFRWLLLTAIALSVPLWMRAIGFRTNLAYELSGMVLVLSSSPAIVEYYQQNLAGLVIFFLAAAAACAASSWLLLSGFLLALATIKPDFSVPLIVCLLLWAAFHWRTHQRLIWSFLISLLALVGGAEVISPHWIPRFIGAVRHYPDYGVDPSIVRLFFPAPVADLITAVLAVAVAVVCWKWRKAMPGSPDFAWAPAWITTATLVLIPKIAAYNQPLLIPALLLLAMKYRTAAKMGWFTRALLKAAFACLFWEWLVAFVLAIASLFVKTRRLDYFALFPEYTSIALTPVTLLALAGITFRGSQEHKHEYSGTEPNACANNAF